MKKKEEKIEKASQPGKANKGTITIYIHITFHTIQAYKGEEKYYLYIPMHQWYHLMSIIHDEIFYLFLLCC
jgi:hypothetical protein